MSTDIDGLRSEIEIARNWIELWLARGLDGGNPSQSLGRNVGNFAVRKNHPFASFLVSRVFEDR